MCGIGGILKRDGQALEASEEKVLQRMARQVAYRGPDDEQMVVCFVSKIRSLSARFDRSVESSRGPRLAASKPRFKAR